MRFFQWKSKDFLGWNTWTGKKIKLTGYFTTKGDDTHHTYFRRTVYCRCVIENRKRETERFRSSNCLAKCSEILSIRFKFCDTILRSVAAKMYQSRLTLVISHWVHENILMSGFRWLAQKKWYGNLFLDFYESHALQDYIKIIISSIRWNNSDKSPRLVWLNETVSLIQK